MGFFHLGVKTPNFQGFIQIITAKMLTIWTEGNGVEGILIPFKGRDWPLWKWPPCHRAIATATGNLRAIRTPLDVPSKF
ncbi:hypothetical protein [Laspinema palackyanum]|uniref:hypothetical protein n=1 Tax=Laspinema palackyanum TaxID=3231601 RepID=UPI00345CDA47|nr:hypothetical protein [Laspinema sp. D2c]